MPDPRWFSMPGMNDPLGAIPQSGDKIRCLRCDRLSTWPGNIGQKDVEELLCCPHCGSPHWRIRPSTGMPLSTNRVNWLQWCTFIATHGDEVTADSLAMLAMLRWNKLGPEHLEELQRGIETALEMARGKEPDSASLLDRFYLPSPGVGVQDGGQSGHVSTAPTRLTSIGFVDEQGNPGPFRIGARSTLRLHTFPVHWAILRVAGLQARVLATGGSSADDMAIVPAAESFRIGGGADLFDDEDGVPLYRLDTPVNAMVALRNYPLLRSPNEAQVTIVCRGGNAGWADVDVTLVAEVLQDDNAFYPSPTEPQTNYLIDLVLAGQLNIEQAIGMLESSFPEPERLDELARLVSTLREYPHPEVVVPGIVETFSHAPAHRARFFRLFPPQHPLGIELVALLSDALDDAQRATVRAWAEEAWPHTLSTGDAPDA